MSLFGIVQSKEKEILCYLMLFNDRNPSILPSSCSNLNVVLHLDTFE